MEGTIIALMKQILSCSLIGLTSLTPTNKKGRSLSKLTKADVEVLTTLGKMKH